MISVIGGGKNILAAVDKRKVLIIILCLVSIGQNAARIILTWFFGCIVRTFCVLLLYQKAGIKSIKKTSTEACYIHWGKTFNLKTMAKTLIYLQENGLTDLDALDTALEDAHKKVTTSRTSIKAIEQTLKEKKELQRQVLNAHAGKDLHAEYLKLPKKKQEKLYEENRPALMLYDAAMRYFKENGVKTIPTVKRI